MNTKNNKTNARLNLNATDMTVSISGLGRLQSKKVEVLKGVKQYVEINWTSGQFIVNLMMEAGNEYRLMRQICRSTKPSYSFAAYFEACGSILV